MQTSFDTAFYSEVRPRHHVERHLGSSSFHLRLQRAKWSEFGEGVFTPPLSFMQLTMVGTPLLAWYDGGRRARESARIGEIAFIPPGRSLNCRWTPHHQRVLSCMFDLEKLSRQAGANDDWSRMDHPEAALDIKNPYIGMALRRITEELAAPGFASEPQIECSLLFITHELDRQFSRSPTRVPTERGKLGGWRLALIRETLSGDLDAGLSVCDMAEACGCSVRQLSQLYRNATGETLRASIARARVERAKVLLLNPEMQIKRAASLTGFHTLSAFSAAFRQSTGATPSEFRQSSGLL